jgi:hypothetical protein
MPEGAVDVARRKLHRLSVTLRPIRRANGLAARQRGAGSCRSASTSAALANAEQAITAASVQP